MPLNYEIQSSFKVDGAFTKHVVDRIYEAKLSFGCGLVVVLNAANLSKIKQSLVNLMKSGVRVACFVDSSRALSHEYAALKSELVELAVDHNLPIENIPGTSLVTYALS